MARCTSRREVKRAKRSLQPIFEAFTNSLEAIKIREENGDDFDLEITVTTNSRQGTDGEQIKEQHKHDVEKLKEMFLLSDDDIDFNISVNDTENKILEKAYSNEAKKVAWIDANI